MIECRHFHNVKPLTLPIIEEVRKSGGKVLVHCQGGKQLEISQNILAVLTKLALFRNQSVNVVHHRLPDESLQRNI